MKPIKLRSGCPVSYTLDFLGDKWSLLILRDIVLFDKSTYGEFLTSNEKIATNILSDRLSLLESNGFITKRVAPDKKSKYIYTSTEKGLILIPLIMEMALWGSQYNPPGLTPELLSNLTHDKAGTINLYKQRMKSRQTDEAYPG